jgi:transposase-like protein
MALFASAEALFAGWHIGVEIVVLCIRWYLKFKLSYRDLVSMIRDRGMGWLTRQS